MAIATPAVLQAKLADYHTSFRRITRVCIVLDLLLGLWMLCFPGRFADFLGLNPVYPLIWIRLAGLLMVLLGFFYVPAAIHALRFRFTAYYGVYAVRGTLFLFFFSAALSVASGFLWLMLYELTLFVAQALLLHRASRAHLAAKP